MNQNLYERFKSINEWLKFAETKHTAFIALNGAGVFGVLSTFPTLDGICLYSKGTIILFFSISIISSIISFIPSLRRVIHYKVYNDEEFNANKHKINSLYFGELAMLTSKQLLEVVKENDQINTFKKVDSDLADQIIQNSKIALSKYNYFTFSAWMTLLGIIMGIVNLFIFKGC